MFFSKKATYKTKHYMALCANVIYFGVFLFAIFIQLIRFPSKLSAKDLLLINLLMVLSARIILYVLSYHELVCTHHTDNKNSLMKYKKVAHTAEVLSTTIAIIIQIIAIHQVAVGNLEIVSSNKTAIHTKGAVDFACILIKLLIVSPLLIYFNYHRMKQNKHITQKKHLVCLFSLSIVSLVIGLIAFVGKIINVLEQTRFFSLFDTENHHNNGPINFPLGPLIRISCIAISILLTITILKIELSTNLALSDIEIQDQQKILNNSVSG